MVAIVPFRTLLYRYLFFDWLFEDVSVGTRLQRAAAWRHNQQQARWLPTYLRRWLFVTVALYAFGGALELLLAVPVASALFYVPSVLGVSVNAVIAVAWVGLKRLPAP
jgi:hypothetical protein